MVANLSKPKAREVTMKLITCLESFGVEVMICADKATALGYPEKGVSPKELATAECVLVLGGDGTFLRAAHLVKNTGTPLLGINMGHLGFLTEVELKDLRPAIEKLIAGDYQVRERMMLSASVKCPGSNSTYKALNDVVITKKNVSPLRLETYVCQSYLDTYRADGLIIASPTGSTAYSLSAGGPLVSPELQVMIITPICPHSLYARPLVVSGEKEIKVKINDNNVMLTVDGQEEIDLDKGSIVTVTKDEIPTRIIRLNSNFYDVVREKLREGRYRQDD